MMQIAGIVAVALLAAVLAFQLALALGAPWGAAAWGGAHHGVLPKRLRIASAFAGVVAYPIIIAVVLAASGLIDATWVPVDPTIAMWILAGVLGVGALGNFASRSPRERLWGPVALAVAVCCAIIAVS